MELPRLGSSLLEPSIKELTKESLSRVPPRYVKTDHDPPITSDTISILQVPVIDMQMLRSKEFKHIELQKFHNACKDWGFFQLTNHGVVGSLLDRVKLGVKEFFNLPIEEKKKLWQQPGEMEGFGQAFVMSEEQKLDWADLFQLISLPAHLRKPYFFPKFPLPFRDDLEAYSTELNNLGNELLNFMTEALNMDPNDVKQVFGEGLQMMRMNYYPPCPEPELVIGLAPHSDASGLTIVLQINEIEGLKIKKDGMWVVTNGIYPSMVHCATVNSEKERLSIATFHSPSLDGEMGPAPSLLTQDTPALFRRIKVADFYNGFFSRELVGKSYLDVLRIQNEDGQKD
ncbi:protein SRG1-like [Tripterygium wilfordii]|uniref:Protein SRG1-like n=1 Tax=Tripterygium wilfordii TaxID=458696 RepID=A0A7J7C4T7_TRIWF|nr:protein SRG1-like [Tripterygium wilfordii]KAF5729128.1 protein SRG1-like [Tripterygium wilfordii]